MEATEKKKYDERNGFIQALLSLRGLIFIYFVDERGEKYRKREQLSGSDRLYPVFQPLVTAHHTCSRLVTYLNIRFLGHGNSKK